MARNSGAYAPRAAELAWTSVSCRLSGTAYRYVGPEREEVFIKSTWADKSSGNTVTLRYNIAGRFGQYAFSSDVFDYIGAMKKAYLRAGH
jgi:hypothetical protein